MGYAYQAWRLAKGKYLAIAGFLVAVLEVLLLAFLILLQCLTSG